ncbi:MAG TPA: YegS/Rv2252/BmrU family lipid kinase [Bacteroidales bacterium]|nr:YegS/Rv2252/BmrU family lipid kinase [Bacteroidales bacterium]
MKIFCKFGMTMPHVENKNKPLFILNPTSGMPPVNFIVSKDLDRRKNELTSIKSLSIADSEILVKENLDKFNIFVAAGGDGTVHTVASELVDSNKILGVLPLGSGNGFAKEFGFKLNLRSLLSDIKKAKSVKIDVIEINDNLCLNVAGIGLDSFVAHSFNDLKLRGFLPYVILTFKTFLQLRPFHVNIMCDGEEIVSEKLFVLTIANTRQFGNNAFIAPDARPNDGIIDLVLIKPFPKILGALFIIRLFTKNINKSKYVRYIKTDKEIVIQTDETRFHIDGEPLKISGKVVVRIKREALNVLKTAHNKFIT